MKPNPTAPSKSNMTAERLQSLYELIGRMNSVYDLQALLEFVVDRALSLTSGRRGLLLLSDEESSLPHVTVVRGEKVDTTELEQVVQQASTTVISDVLARGEPRLIADLLTDRRYEGLDMTATGKFKRIRSVLAVPLKVEKQRVGLLYIDHPRRAIFGPSDLEFLSAFANQAALAIHRTRQHQRQIEELTLLNELSRRVVRVLDLEEVLTRIVSEVCRMLGVETGSVLLLDEATSELVFATAVFQGRRVKIATRLQKDQGIAGWVVTHGQPACVGDVIRDPRWFGEVEAQFTTRSLLCVPLKLEDRTLGVLQALNKKNAAGFDPGDVALLSAFAASATIAIENARLFREAGQVDHLRAQALHLAYLNEIGSALTSSLDLSHILQVIIEGVRSLLETERVSVFLIDASTNELVLRYGTEGDMDIRLPAPWQGIAGWVARHDQPTLVNDTLSDPRYLRRIAVDTGYEAHSILCVPLKIEGQVIGVVEVLNKTGGRPFNHHDQEVLAGLTRWAAIAIHNARLFEERVQAYQHLADEQQRRTAAEMRGAMADVILSMAHTMNNIVGAIRVWALTLENEPLSDSQAATFKKMIGQIRQNAEEAIELIRNMRGPLETAVLAPTDIHLCLAAAIRSCWWPDNVHLNKSYAPNLPPVEANAQRLETVFHNLLSNAIQALAQTGGEVRLQTALTAEGSVQVIISDNGPGIPPDIQEHLFDPGISNKDGGLGIGLWLVETFIRQFDGSIECVSSPGAGATFTVSLTPLCLSEAAAQEMAAGEIADGSTE